VRGVARLMLLGGALLVASTAGAQDDLEEEARALFQAGRVAFDAGRYDDALEHFDDAYARSQRPELLYNVGLAADRAGRAPLAVRAYTKFLEEVTDSPNRGTVEERLAALRAREGASESGEAPAEDAPPLIMGPASTSTEPTSGTQPETQSQPETLAQQSNPGVPVTRAQEQQGTDRRMTPPPNRTGPVLFIVGGAVLLVGGAAITGLAFQAKSRAEEETSWARANELSDQAGRRSGVGLALVGVGVVAAVAGFVWRASQDRAFTLTLGPGGIDLRGTF